MNEALYVARATLEKLGSLHRRARLSTGESAEMGVHGPIAAFYHLAPERALPLPVDYIVAATGGWMLGTLNGALEARQVFLEPADLRTEVEGVNEVRDGLPVLTEVRVRYRLRIPAAARERVDRALARHQDKCPTANSLKGAVRVSWSAEIDEIAGTSA